jgi:hypothetical protein
MSLNATPIIVFLPLGKLGAISTGCGGAFALVALIGDTFDGRVAVSAFGAGVGSGVPVDRIGDATSGPGVASTAGAGGAGSFKRIAGIGGVTS